MRRIKIGIRREDKNIWEKRTPLVPEHIKKITGTECIDVAVQPSENRIFSDDEFRESGAVITEDLNDCRIILGVKEMPVDFLSSGMNYMYFSHVIKGQSYNMGMLRKLIELNCTLIDYERIVTESGNRIISFGRFAGLAGMIDSLWAFGEKLKGENVATPFESVSQAYQFADLTAAEDTIKEVGEKIADEGLPDMLHPLTVGFAGYGNVSAGAQEIFDLLPHETVEPQELIRGLAGKSLSNRKIYKTVFKEKDIVEPLSVEKSFDLQEYYDHPERYRAIFGKYVPHLTMLLNCIYWEEKYPRLISDEMLRRLYHESGSLKLKVIGDISCDVEGAIEPTKKTTDPGKPVYVYDPIEEKLTYGTKGAWPAILAVDNLPCELSREASEDFSSALKPFIPAIAESEYKGTFEELELPPEIKRAVIVYRGELTSEYKYLHNFLQQ